MTVLTLYQAHPFGAWIALAAALLALEVATGSGWLLWPSASAAVTAVQVGVKSLPVNVKVVFDRPFLMVIRERTTGAFLFLGKILSP